MALKVILDTRFFFSYYNPEDENIGGWSRKIVEKISKGDIEAFSSTITVTELYNTMGRVIGKDVVKLRILSMKQSNISFIPLDEEIAHLAGMIALKIARIPLADAIIAATALIHAGGVVLTDDEHFKLIKGIRIRWLDRV